MNPKDGGSKSRKLWFAIGTSISILAAALLSSEVPALVPMYDTLVGGLLGCLALYLGGNVGAKHVLKSAKETPPVEG